MLPATNTAQWNCLEELMDVLLRPKLPLVWRSSDLSFQAASVANDDCFRFRSSTQPINIEQRSQKVCEGQSLSRFMKVRGHDTNKYRTTISFKLVMDSEAWIVLPRL